MFQICLNRKYVSRRLFNNGIHRRNPFEKRRIYCRLTTKEPGGGGYKKGKAFKDLAPEKDSLIEKKFSGKPGRPIKYIRGRTTKGF